MGATNSKSMFDEDIPWNSSTSMKTHPLNDKPIEPFNLIWLDEDALTHSVDTLQTQLLLRQISNDNCLFLDEFGSFIQEIEKMTKEHKKFLVVMSGSFARKVLSKIRMHGISIVIIFSQDYQKYVTLTKEHYNVVNICTNLENLKSCIQEELTSLKFNLFENQELTTIRPLFFPNEINNRDAYFSYMLFIEFLKQMPQTKQAKDIMLDKCKDHYRNNRREIEQIEEFRSRYTAKDAMYWFTRDAFIYRLANRAYRTDDITLWYLFRYYAVDLCTQLENVHKEQNIQTPMTLYRGQAHMSKKEFEYLKSNVGGLVTTNGFFSTSREIVIAKQFILGAVDSEDFKTVMFEITVDGSHLQNTVFVDIDQYTKIFVEADVLFNIGSVFKIKEVTYNAEDGVWYIKMEATDEGTHEIKRKIDAKRNEFRQENMNLMFGQLMIDMNEYIKAESYFQRMLQLLPKSHKDLPLVHDCIGEINMRTTNWQEALHHTTLAYEMKKKKLSVDHPLMGITYQNIGNYYKAIEEYLRALKWYEKALRCEKDPLSAARIQLNIVAIFTMMNGYDKAMKMCIEVRDILQQMDPCPYSEIIQYQILIGKIYFAQNNYAIAIEYYRTSFEMCKKRLSITDRLRMDSINCLVDLYRVEGMKHEALDLCLDELALCEKYLSSNHVNIAHLTMKIGELWDDGDQQKLDSLLRALDIFEKCSHIEYAATANCLMAIGVYYHKKDEYNKARRYLNRALQTRKKIYPEGHQNIEHTQLIIDAIESVEEHRETKQEIFNNM